MLRRLIERLWPTEEWVIVEGSPGDWDGLGYTWVRFL